MISRVVMVVVLVWVPWDQRDPSSMGSEALASWAPRRGLFETREAPRDSEGSSERGRLFKNGEAPRDPEGSSRPGTLLGNQEAPRRFVIIRQRTVCW